MKNILKIIPDNFGLILLLFSLFGYFFPEFFLWGKSYTDEMLMLTLFLGCLKINFSEVFHLKENILKMFGLVFLSLILLPFVFYIFSFALDPEIRLGFFLLLAASGAVTTSFMANILNLKILWGTVFVILTSVLLPFTLPFLIYFLFDISVEISVINMSLFLLKMVVIPAVLALIFKQFFKKSIKIILPYSGVLGVLGIALMLSVLAAINQEFLSENLLKPSTGIILIGLFVLFFVRFFMGYVLPSENIKEKLTNSLMFGTMNNALLIILAAEFFTEKVLLILLLSEIPWIVVQPFFQKFVKISLENKK